MRLLTLPPSTRTMVVVCETLIKQRKLFRNHCPGAVPAMMEFLIKLAITVMNNYVDPPLPTDGEAFC